MAPRYVGTDQEIKTNYTAPTRNEIAAHAYERFQERGGRHGYDLEDWLEAERELLASRLASPAADDRDIDDEEVLHGVRDRNAPPHRYSTRDDGRHTALTRLVRGGTLATRRHGSAGRVYSM